MKVKDMPWAMGTFAVAAGSVSGLLTPMKMDASTLQKLDDAIKPELFVDLVATSIGAAAFLYFLADRYRSDSSRSAKDADANTLRGHARSLETAARHFTIAFVLAVCGMVSSFSLDSVYQSQFHATDYQAVTPSQVLSLLRENIPGTAEIAVGTFVLASIVYQYLSGAFRLLGTFLVRQE